MIKPMTVPVFCDRKVIMKVKLIPEENMTAEEFVEQGVKELGSLVIDELKR